MAGILSYAAAGAAAGLGAGLVQQGKDRRELWLKQMEMDQENARDDRNYAREQGELSDTTTDENGNLIGITKGGGTRPLGVRPQGKAEDLVETQGPDGQPVYTPKSKAAGMTPASKTDLIARTVQDAQGNWVGVTGSGKTIPLNVKGKLPGVGQPDRTVVQVWDPDKKMNVWKPREQAVGMEAPHGAAQTSGDAGGLSDSDNRLLGFVTKRHTTKDRHDVETTDWGAVATDLRMRGRKDLADLAVAPPTDDRSTKEDDTGYGDGTDPDTNPALQGNPAPAAAPAAAPTTAPALATPQTPKPPTLKGSGTQTDPYQAAAQPEVDWFVRNASPGSVLVVGGKRYTKKPQN